MKNKLLTMNVYMNAWLDCSHPFISIHNKLTDEVLAHFNEEHVENLINNGEIVIEDLQSADPSIQMNIISLLIAQQSREKIKKQITKLCISLKRRNT